MLAVILYWDWEEGAGIGSFCAFKEGHECGYGKQSGGTWVSGESF
jgi:hypothetical protein